MVGRAGSTAAGGGGTGAGDETGVLVIPGPLGIAGGVTGEFVAFPTCPQTTAGARITAAKIPTNSRTAVIVSSVKLPKNLETVQFSSEIATTA